jgi:AraC-like DNA-binding protein/ligand-binding sensor protein
MSALHTEGTCGSLAETQIYRDYWKAYTEATGLPLRLRDAAQSRFVLEPGKGASPLCMLLARTNVSCQACLAMQQRVEQEARITPKTLKCFAGLCETAVPVRVGENIVAWLETGHILIDHPTKSKFNRLAKTLLRWGTHVDLKQVEEAYFNTRVIAPSQYEAAVQLLQIFAGNLAQFGQQIALQNKENESLTVNKARQWVAAHCEDSVSLAAAAQAVNLSAKYFSDVFRKATGIPFVEYVGRVRVEKAKDLLVNPQLRISEIAFEVGFQSLSQFNRAFRRHAGKSPRDYRHALPEAANRQKTGKMRSLSGDVRRTASDPLASYQSSNRDIPHLNKQQIENLE